MTEFVALAETESSEQLWLRRALQAHLHFTGSPRASRLLSRKGAFPLVRIQPVHFQGTIEDTWKPVLERLRQREPLLVVRELSPISQAAVHA